LAQEVVTKTRERTQGQVGIPYVSDGWEPYVTTITTTYAEREPSGIRDRWDILRPTEGIRLTQAVKHRGPEGTPRRLERVEVRATIGEPIDQPYAVHLEWLNGTLRDRLNCLTRKTPGFAKEVASWNALFRLSIFEQNWLRPHIALRVPLPEPCDGRLYFQRTRPWSSTSPTIPGPGKNSLLCAFRTVNASHYRKLSHCTVVLLVWRTRPVSARSLLFCFERKEIKASLEMVRKAG